MKHILIFFIATILVIPPKAHGLDLFKKTSDGAFNYTAWIDTANVATSANGHTLFYPITDNEDVAVRGEITVSGQSSEKIFLSALNYVVDHLDSTDGHEQIGEINPDEKSFMVRQFSRQGSNNNETTFTYLTLIKADEGKLLFLNTEIDVKYREKGLIPRTVAFEKLNPATNHRHRELVEQFVNINSKYLFDLASYIPESQNLEVNHWEEISNKDVVKGMNQFEVKLILGKPITERDNGDRIRWVYPKNYVLLFESGKLSRILE